MSRKNGSVMALLKHIRDNNYVTLPQAREFLKEHGATGNGSSTVHQLVCEMKEVRRAKAPDGTFYLFRKGFRIPEDFHDYGYDKLRVEEKKRASKVDDADDDDYLICIKWKDGETLTLTPAEAQSLWNKLSRALNIGQ